MKTFLLFALGCLTVYMAFRGVWLPIPFFFGALLLGRGK